MQIYCPKCHAGYQISDSLVEDKSRRLKCSACGEIFEVGQAEDSYVNDMAEVEPENAFEALSQAMAENEPTKDSETSKVEINKETESEQIAEETEIANLEEKILQQDETANVETDDNRVSDETISVSEEQEISLNETNKKAEEKISGDDGADNELKVEAETTLETAEEVSEESEEPENISLDQIFERLSEHTAHLIEREKKLPVYAKVWLQIKNILGFHFKIKWSYIFVAVGIFALLSLYENRYDVVRKVPFLNGVYKAFGIKAKIAGEGLEFQNVGWEFISDEEGSRLEIKGFINNQTDRDIDLPTVHVEILDKETSLLQSQNRKFEENSVNAQTRLALTMIVKNPAPTAKYVYLTFIEQQD